MSVLDIFRSFAQGTGGQQPPQPKPNPSDNTTIPGDKTPKSDGSVGAIPKAGEGDKSPLENYSKLFDTDPTKVTPEPTMVPTMTMDPKKLMEAAKGLDFSKTVPPELMTRVLAGNDQQAVVDLVNHVGQVAYAQSAGASGKIVEAALTQQAKLFSEKVMPEVLRRYGASQSIAADNPIYANPAAKPVIKLIEDRLVQQNPKATPAEIAKQAQDYFLDLSTEIIKSAGKQVVDAPVKGDQQKASNKDQDWTRFFGEQA